MAWIWRGVPLYEYLEITTVALQLYQKVVVHSFGNREAPQTSKDIHTYTSFNQGQIYKRTRTTNTELEIKMQHPNPSKPPVFQPFRWYIGRLDEIFSM